MSSPIAYATHIATHWIATVAMLPRDNNILKCVNKKIKALYQVPLRWRGAAQRRGGQRVQECLFSLSPGTLPPTHSLLSLRAIADGVAIQ